MSYAEKILQEGFAPYKNPDYTPLKLLYSTPKVIAVKQNDQGQNRARNDGKTIRVALIGVGNCASSLVQGVEFYKNARVGDKVPGLMHVELGGYHIRDIEFTAAFDI